jgi:alpha-D-xyloside xylohydrolase
VYETNVGPDRVSIVGLIPEGMHASKIHGRTLTMDVTCPHEGVFRVQVRHHAPARRPDEGFLLPGLRCLPLASTRDAAGLHISGGGMELTFPKEGWRYRFSGPGGLMCESGRESLGIVECDDGSEHIAEKLSLRPGETIYGLGERFSPFVRNGQSVRMWNADAGTSSDLAYKNVPFYLSSEGYGILVNTTAAVEFEVATEDNAAVGITVPGRFLDYLVICGGTPRGVLSILADLVGKPPRVPLWSLGLWLTTSFTTSYDERTIFDHVNGMADRGIPLSVFHFDCFWMRERHWCDFTWNPDAFPDPPRMIAQLKDRGLRVCLWINPYISELSALFEEGAREGYFLRRKTGEVYQVDWWQPGLAFVDFTNPAACDWFVAKLRPLLEMGVDTFKTDFGESAPADAVCYDGTDGALLHNRYGLLFNRTVFDLLARERGEGNALVFARSGTMGSQRYPVHWGGDSKSTYSSMAAQLRAGLSYALSGCAFWSHDIGGFYGTPTPDLYKRWVAFGLLSSHSRLHGDSSYRVPWNFDEESVAVLRHFARLRLSLTPYLARCVEEAHESGCPLMRPMVLAFPGDPGCRYLDRQYMLGEELLVAPILNEEGRADYYLPPGHWCDFATGKVVEGGGWRGQICDYFSLPLLVKGNSLIPVGPPEGVGEGGDWRGAVLRVYDLTGRASFTLRDSRGAVEVQAERSGNTRSFRLSRALDGVRVAFMGDCDVGAVTGKARRTDPCDGAPAVLVEGTSFAVRDREQ